VQNDPRGVRLAATDLANHLACRHLTQLDRAVAEGRMAAPAWRDPSLALLQERGLAHERAFVDHLRAQGLHVADLREEGGGPAPQRTLEAMRAGAPVIVQAALAGGRWVGRADLLLRVEEPSELGRWSYEVADTKLALETGAGTVLQLCLYSELIAEAQGRLPERMYVVKPGPGFTREEYRFADFRAYFRLVRRRLEEAVDAPPQSTYPDPVPHCDVCRWRQVCDARRHADDNLCLVAGIRPLHTAELERQGVGTLTQFAREPAPVRQRPQRGNLEAFARAQGQAQVQLAGRVAGKPVHELLPLETGRGFALLPTPDPGDVFFDIESDPFALEGGLEYLLGFAYAEGGGVLHYNAVWALDRSEERAALEALIDFVMARWHAHPAMHVYHFSPYEPAAVKRLIGRYGMRETELDQLLRAGRFVDLLAVTRQAMRVSVESYSLKALEESFGFTRQTELPAAGAALRRVAWALELAGRTEITAEDRDTVEAYNREDCLSTAALRDWLEARRRELEESGSPVPRPLDNGGEASASVRERAAEIQAVYDALVQGLPEDRETWTAAEKARWLLAHQLEYFKREDNCAWWEFFRIHELGHEDLLDERKAISGLRFVGNAGSAVNAPVHRYSFPEQEAAFDPGDELYVIGGDRIGKVAALDLSGCTIDIAKSSRGVDVHPAAVMVNERVNPSPVDHALLELARSAAKHGVDGEGPYRAARDLLLKRHPRLRPSADEAPFLPGLLEPAFLRPPALLRPREAAVAAAVRLVKNLDNGVLPIQGPPGTGKTFTGARMIVALAREGKRIGVTAVSHKVIRNLLGAVMAAAVEQGVQVSAVHKVSKPSGDEGIEETTEASRAKAGLEHGKITGGTAWFWASDAMIQSVDYLFIDEAGQMSLAHALAAGRAARNIVLLGDPQQLEQPSRGAHPEGADVAALVHLLEGKKTIADEAGLFLAETWRLHPAICAFTSQTSYEGRLRPRAGLERQALRGSGFFDGSGLFYVPVEHAGNQNSSPEEAEMVCRIVSILLAPSVRWSDSRGAARRIHGSDILVVAPYNAQVAALTVRLPAAVRVGTVDRFQGQQAPVVIYSMASSSAGDAPRGMGFLYNPNRLNVATSRAQSTCILVAAPRLLEPECSSPQQMRWANGLCLYREMAKEVVLQAET
jgi:predicted RecB family nuclease